MATSGRLHLRFQGPLASVVPGVVQPAVFLSVTMLAAGQLSVTTRAALGCGLLGLWGATVWNFGLVLRAERQLGTLAGIVCRPTGLTLVLVGKGLAAAGRSTVLIALTVAAVSLLTGSPVRIAAPVPFLAALVATVVSATALGLLLSALFLLTRSAIRIAEALTYPVFILGGLLVPVTLLPAWAQPLSTVVSLHWASDLLAAAAAGQPQRPLDWAMLAGTTVAYAVAAYAVTAVILRKVRRDGTLDLL